MIKYSVKHRYTMKGIVLGAGKGTRLYPASQGVSKVLLPVYDKPMVYYPLSTLMKAGITDIMVITSQDDESSFKRLLGDGSQFGIKLSYAVQEVQRGIGDAFIIAEHFIGDDGVALALGDNIFYGSEMDILLAKAAAEIDGATIFCKRVNNPEVFGVAEMDQAGQVWSLEEKPKKPKSDLAVTGLYFYGRDAVRFAKRLKPSSRGELEVTDLNRIYMEEGRLHALVLPDMVRWMDAGTFESMFEASNFIRE